MRPKDVKECVEIIATHPVIGPRYGKTIECLAPAWLKLLGSEAMHATVIEAEEDGQARICFVGVTLCVNEDFIRELKTPPIGWFGPELARRVLNGNSPVLTEKQIQECNSRSGLNLITWEGCIRPGFEKHTEIYREVIRTFLRDHQGFLWKEVIASQAENVQLFQWTLSTGGLWWNPEKAKYVDTAKDPAKIIETPHILGVTRAVETQRPSSWVGDLFSYRPPQCGFSRSEQQLLLAALDGATDEELAKTLCVSLTTVKKTWVSIYGRAASRLPQLISNHCDTEPSAYRGKEKRRRLLTYLRDHLEELRPFSVKLLPGHE